MTKVFTNEEQLFQFTRNLTNFTVEQITAGVWRVRYTK